MPHPNARGVSRGECCVDVTASLTSICLPNITCADCSLNCCCAAECRCCVPACQGDREVHTAASLRQSFSDGASTWRDSIRYATCNIMVYGHRSGTVPPPACTACSPHCLPLCERCPQPSGAVVRYKRYHSDKYIWPVGWKSEREFFSYVNVGTRVKYTCEILDGGGMGPKFTVRATHRP